MRTPIGSVAIDTVPLPEEPMGDFRFEYFFLHHLFTAKAIDRHTDLMTRNRLTIEAIRAADSLGYLSAPSRTVGTVSDLVFDDARMLLVDALVANKAIKPEHRARWLKIARSTDFVDFAPSLFLRITFKGWDSEKALGILDRSFTAVAGTAMPVPNGGDWEKHCREHPEDPVCHVIDTRLTSSRARDLARGTVLVWELHREGLLNYEQTRAIYDVAFKALTRRRGMADLSIPAGGIITDHLRLEPDPRAEIFRSLGINRVGVVDPESPWAERCLGEEPPPICRFIMAFPVAAAFTTQLVRHKIWERQEAVKAWTDLFAVTGGGVAAPKELVEFYAVK